MVVSEWRRSRRRNASPTIFDAPPSGSGFLEGRRLRSAASSEARGRAELSSATDSIPVLPEGWAVLYARSCTAITSYL